MLTLRLQRTLHLAAALIMLVLAQVLVGTYFEAADIFWKCVHPKSPPFQKFKYFEMATLSFFAVVVPVAPLVFVSVGRKCVWAALTGATLMYAGSVISFAGAWTIRELLYSLVGIIACLAAPIVLWRSCTSRYRDVAQEIVVPTSLTILACACHLAAAPHGLSYIEVGASADSIRDLASVVFPIVVFLATLAPILFCKVPPNASVSLPRMPSGTA